MMTRLTFICHGATDAVRQARFPLDEALEDKAIIEARALAPGMPRADHFMTSPALRARQTADALGLEAEVVPTLADCDYGRWAGQPIMALQESEPDALSTWLTDTDAAPHGGESIRAVHDRVAPWMQAQSALGGHAIAISHAPTIRVAVLIALGAPLSSFWHIDVEPLSAVRMTSNGTRWSLRFDRV
ncbi:histidine phosphatase family protein [Rhizobium sp. 16-449-1b]|uniref:histidine phosphatase family protein n=1 Tax=Rhizobium sp. 16-449-1b TaxID=2819989 RepID=UPI001ADA584E|nr:histidine phosphatase family protein [Rhizobium sp. 16-449-1b]